MAENDLHVEDLIHAARSDREALGRLFERYRPFLLLMAQREIGPKLALRADASDVVQQTFAEAHQSFPRFAGATEPEFSAWIKQIHYHNLAEIIRKHAVAAKQNLRQEQRLDALDATASFYWQEPAAEQSTPSQQFIQGEKALRLAGLIASLPEMQREAVRLRYLEGRPVEAIAAALDRSAAATAGLLKRGLKVLRGKMSESSWY
jgi:RNA polymerase sigma-70 factor, ECF subfamily